MKKLLIILLCLPMIGFSQSNYKNLMYDNSVNFYSVCREADKYFELNDKDVKGSGWKQYQRWKSNNEYKYFPSGERHNIDPYFAAKAYKGYIKQNPTLEWTLSSGWVELGPTRVDTTTRHGGPGLGIVNDFYIDPLNPNLMYIGTKSGGFWKSINGGNSWLNTTDFLFASGVNSITAVPANSDSVLISIRNSKNGTTHGIYRSIDAGSTWSITNFNPTNLGLGGLGSDFQITKIEYHPLVPNLVLILSSEGLYRSDDDLETWTLVSSIISTSYPSYSNDFEFHPTDPNIVYSHINNQGKIMISNDMGQSFSVQSNSGFSSFLEVSNDCPDCLYKASSSGVWKSTDNGLSFVFLDAAAGTGWSTWKASFALNDLDTSKMIIGGVEVQNSIDGGQTFNETTAYYLAHPIHAVGSGNPANWTNILHNSVHFVHADIRMAKCVNGVFYIGTDGYFCRSYDNGYSWEKLNQGTGIRENYGLGVSQSNYYRTICGSQDNGNSIKYQDTWIEFNGSDGIDGLIHPLNHDWMIATAYNGGMRPTQDAGMTYYQETGMSTGLGAFESPILNDPNNHMRVYNFTDKIHVNHSFFLSPWDYVGEPISFTNHITAAAIAENNSNIMLIAGGSILEKSVDNGATFSVIGSGLPNNSQIQDIAFDPNNDDVIIVVYASYQNDNSKVFITIDGGNSWSNITHNLNNMPIHAVVIDHTPNANIYLGAEIGVYTKEMQDSSWSLYNPSLPNVTIEELEIVYGSNTLRAATWGRGLWEFNLVGRENFPSILRTQITSPPTDIAPQQNINQYVSAIISYPNTLSSVYLEYSIDDNNSPTTPIEMLNTQDSAWVSESSIPFYPSGTKVYFTVYATGNNNDTTESYQFMYTVKPGDGQVYGCIDLLACNYDASATVNDGICIYADSICDTCSGETDGTGTIVDNDSDDDGVCEDCESMDYIVVDCACEWINPVTYTIFYIDIDELNCITVEDCYCECYNDIDDDNICDEDEVVGCQDELACNYDSDATDEGECIYLNAWVSTSHASCFGVADGIAITYASGGAPPYQYSLGTGLLQTSGTFTNLMAGSYFIDVTDENSCISTFPFTVTEPEDFIAGVEANIFYNEDENGIPYHISCFGFSDGEAAVTNGGGVPPYTYFWSPSGGNGQVETGMSAGLNTVMVADGNGCTIFETIILYEPGLLVSNIFESFYSTSTNGTTNEISCHDANDGWLESQALGGVPSNVGFQYSWVNDNTGSPVSNQALADNLTANTSYTVTVTDANGCVSTETSTILDQPEQNIVSYDTLSVTASIVWNGMTLNISGDYSDTLFTLLGCSIVNLNLTVTTTSVLDVINNKSKLVRITNILGQESPYRKNTLLFYAYDDGSVEKRIVIE